MNSFTITKLVDQSTAYKNSVFLHPSYRSLGYRYIRVVSYHPSILDEKDDKQYTDYVFAVQFSNELISTNQISFNAASRQFLNFTEGSSVQIEKCDLNVNQEESVSFIIEFLAKTKKEFVVDETVVEDLKRCLKGIPLVTNHKYFYSDKATDTKFVIYLTVKDKKNIVIGDDTQLLLTAANPLIKIKTGSALFKGNFNFQEMGIGGLDKQFEVIFRRAFASRVIPEKVASDLGINHVRGILLYGLPGCGKTLIARKMGKVLNCVEPKIVNGPSLLSKYVGESEENVRKLFADAIADKNGEQLHLIICDEFDALVKKRGSGGDNTGTGDKIVNQFLTMIDGPESLNNILLICMTNRKDLIDEAILRPGRLEVQIEIGLPDEKGRKDILAIHTSKMRGKGYMEDVDLGEIAQKCKNFTGAELESVVKTSVSYALARELERTGFGSEKKEEENVKNHSNKINPVVTVADFEKSLSEIKPQFGSKSEIIETICSKPFEKYSVDYANTFCEIEQNIKVLKEGNKMSVLITGPNHIGKTTMAAQLANQSGYHCVKFINAESLLNSNSKDILLNDLIESGLKSESCLFVLDSVEKLIEYSKLGNVYNNKVLQMIYILLDKIIDSNHRCAMILTSSKSELCDALDLTRLVDYTYELEDWNEISQKFRMSKLM